MQTLLLFGCFLPLGLMPAILPLQLIQPIKPLFRWLSLVPLAATLIFLALLQPLSALLSYAIVLPPLLISAVSLVLGIIGMRLVRQARRANERTTWLIAATVAASIPFLVVSPFFIYAFVSLLIQP